MAWSFSIFICFKIIKFIIVEAKITFLVFLRTLIDALQSWSLSTLIALVITMIKRTSVHSINTDSRRLNTYPLLWLTRSSFTDRIAGNPDVNLFLHVVQFQGAYARTQTQLLVALQRVCRKKKKRRKIKRKKVIFCLDKL